MTDAPGLRLEREDGVLTIIIDRPEVRNAVDYATAVAIAAAVDALDAEDDLRVGVLTGAGQTFSSGMDLKSFLRGEPREPDRRGFAGLTEATPAKPLIAAVEGKALAGGCEMALACDLVVAARDAAFGLPEVKIGLIAGSGGLIRLPQRIPHQIAMEHALTGDPLSAVEAHRWGLVNHLTEPGEALAAARALATRIAANAPLAVRTTKHIINQASWTAQEREAWEHQRAVLLDIVASEDAREGSEAFLAKRPPVWRGR